MKHLDTNRHLAQRAEIVGKAPLHQVPQQPQMARRAAQQVTLQQAIQLFANHLI